MVKKRSKKLEVAPLQVLAKRATGLLMLLLFFLFFEPGEQALMHRIVWPAVAFIGAALVLRNLLVLALATLFFAALNSRPGVNDLFTGLVYPGIAVVAGATIIRLTAKRFANRIRITRADRWARRTHAADDKKAKH